MQKFADLHIHTHYSDSTASPEEVVEDALKANLCCIAITDHDTVEGVDPTIQAAVGHDLEIIPGIELSSEVDGKDVHILGYFIDHHNSSLIKIIQKVQKARVERIKKMIEKLKELGIDNIELQEVCALTKSKSVGRPHLAINLIKKGWASNIRQAFDKYLAEGKPAFVPKYKMSPREAIELIQRCNGVAVMAHPMATNRDELIPAMVEDGLQGLEVYYPNYPASTREYYENIAKKHNLIPTGGSDAHGKAKDNTYIGKSQIPYETVEQLKNLVKVH